MARNLYKKHLDTFIKNKNQRILIERHDNFYYISEGFTILRLPAVYYEVFARPVNPMFIVLENGQQAKRQPGEKLPEILPGTADTCKKVWDTTEAINSAKLTPVIMEIDDKQCRIVKTGNKMMMYNERFIAAVRQYCGDDMKCTSDRFPVLKWEGAAGDGCIILGVNNRAAWDNLRKVAEVIAK